MKHQPHITDQHLKSNTPLWKRLIRPSVPAITLGNVVIMLFLAIFATLAAVNLWPTQSTRNYETATVQTAGLNFTNMKLAAYEGMHFEFTQKKSNGQNRGTMGGSSNDGSVLISGTITNITDSEIFLTDALPPNSFIYDDEPGFYMILGSEPRKYATPIMVSNSPFALGGQNNELAGYYINPNEKLNFELIEYDMRIESEDQFDLAFVWTILDPTTFEPSVIHPQFHFTRKGSSIVWGSTSWKRTHIKWHRDAPITK